MLQDCMEMTPDCREMTPDCRKMTPDCREEIPGSDCPYFLDYTCLRDHVSLGVPCEKRSAEDRDD